VRKKKEKNQQKKNKNYVDPEKLVVSEPIEITQEFCYFDFASPWEQMKKKKHVKSYRKAWEIMKTKGVRKATVLFLCLLEYYLIN
jgi:hypothetical protein